MQWNKIVHSALKKNLKTTYLKGKITILLGLKC